MRRNVRGGKGRKKFVIKMINLKEISMLEIVYLLT